MPYEYQFDFERLNKIANNEEQPPEGYIDFLNQNEGEEHPERDVLYDLAYLTHKGYFEQTNVCKRNYDEALPLYQRSADLGCIYAKCSLGYLYETGRGVLEDLEEAKRLYLAVWEDTEYSETRQSVSKQISASRLAKLYASGKIPEGPAEEQTAKYWLEKAAEVDDEQSQHLLVLANQQIELEFLIPNEQEQKQRENFSAADAHIQHISARMQQQDEIIKRHSSHHVVGRAISRKQEREIRFLLADPDTRIFYNRIRHRLQSLFEASLHTSTSVIDRSEGEDTGTTVAGWVESIPLPFAKLISTGLTTATKQYYQKRFDKNIVNRLEEALDQNPDIELLAESIARWTTIFCYQKIKQNDLSTTSIRDVANVAVTKYFNALLTGTISTQTSFNEASVQAIFTEQSAISQWLHDKIPESVRNLFEKKLDDDSGTELDFTAESFLADEAMFNNREKFDEQRKSFMAQNPMSPSPSSPVGFFAFGQSLQESVESLGKELEAFKMQLGIGQTGGVCFAVLNEKLEKIEQRIQELENNNVESSPQSSMNNPNWWLKFWRWFLSLFCCCHRSGYAPI